MQHQSRRSFIANAAMALAAGAGAASTHPVFAQTATHLPEGIVNFILPVAPGGGTDLTFRALAEATKGHLNRTIIVLNQPGAGNAVGLTSAASKAANGLWLVSYTSEIFTLPIFQPVKFSAKDFKPVILVNEDPACLIVPADSKLNTIEAFVAAAKAKPGGLTVGNSGFGNIWHISAAAFAEKAGISVLQVPYSGAAPTVQAILSSQIDAMVASPPEVASYVEGGKMKILAVMADKRSAAFPNVPTLKEKGIDVAIGTWRGIGVPAGTPDAAVKELHDAFAKGMQERSFIDFMNSRGLAIRYMPTQQFADFAARERPGFEALATQIQKTKQ
ncbi:tripartite tricarboxylate transporter substrate binding protein [Xenophilus aerolatus]|nr:tripartite tricarboxylate transporter substrate binding protein [Xenophilus aerolatus]